MSPLSKRLEVRLDEQRFKMLEDESRRRGRSVSELVREAIDTCYPAREERVSKKLKAVEELGKVKAPVSDWEQMEEEIRRGMLG